ncbi:MAG: CRISPR-associated Cse2 family protein [Elusimicrobia bacterium]|nr:MAG: CRISPR-associated Cse2 family protein [Elusimicrobiota bacterium]KAF0157102.1 MAG: CRISPR-associated Cse2 family protein [Elusimicrobiota bacterium]
MSGFIAWLEKINTDGRKAKAVLRRSLAFAPGAYVPAYPYVEPFLTGEENPWRREMYYLAAGLWAAHYREGRAATGMTLGKACAAHQGPTDSASTERRFITMLDSDPDQLPYRLRQLLALLKEQPVDFEGLLAGLLRWNDVRKFTQNSWARDFYRELARKTNEQEKTNENLN